MVKCYPKFSQKERAGDIVLPVTRLQPFFEDLVGVEVKILVHMTEYSSMETVLGYSHTRIVIDKVVVKFLSPNAGIFTSGAFLHGRVSRLCTLHCLVLLLQIAEYTRVLLGCCAIRRR